MLEDIENDKETPKAEFIEKRPILNVWDKFDINSSKEFTKLNNRLADHFKVNPLEYSIKDWFVSVDQYKKDLKNMR